MQGTSEVLRRLEKARQEKISLVEKALLQGAMVGEANIKQNWANRSATGRGFQTRSGTLVRSIGSTVVKSGDSMKAYVYSNQSEFRQSGVASGVYYAPIVEHMLSGKYAFMFPGVMEVMHRIWEKIASVAKGA